MGCGHHGQKALRDFQGPRLNGSESRNAPGKFGPLAFVEDVGRHGSPQPLGDVVNFPAMRRSCRRLAKFDTRRKSLLLPTPGDVTL